MLKHRLRALLVTAGCLLAITAEAAAPPAAPVAGPLKAQHLTVELLPLQASIQPGHESRVGLHFTLEKGWHVYWINAGDSGEPPSIRWSLPAGITAAPMLFPAPRRLPLGPLMDFGYENEVLFPITLTAASTLKAPSTADLTARVNWLVCREVCIPGKGDLALPLPIAAQPGAVDPVRRALFDRFQKLIPQQLPAAAKAVFAASATGFNLALTGHPATSAEFFPLDQSQIQNAAPQPVSGVKDGIQIALRKDESLQTKLSQLNGVLLLSDGSAYEIHAPSGVLPAGTGALAGAAGLTLATVLRFVGLAFLGGIILNLMPCVFPVLFIKGLSLVESSRHEHSRVRMHGLVYTLGIVVSFWAVVALLIGLRAGGRQLGWGFQFQSPGFIAVMALLLFFLGLSLAGMFEIGLTVTNTGSGLASRGGYSGSFFTGVLAMVVATPCTAPFMGAAIGFALAHSTLVAFAVFTALALGLAAPYLVLTFNPTWMRVLPRPGAWMEVLKQATAAPIFATVIWLVWLFASTAGVDAVAALLAGFLLLAIAGWILGRWPARRVPAMFALSVILLAVATPLYALWKLPTAGAATSNVAQQAGWQPFSRAAIEQYRGQGRPVFVDFTARWCLSCQVNERAVLNRTDVQRRLHDSGIVLLRADWTKHDEAIGSALADLGRSGVPTYVFYLPGKPPLILPEVLTPGLMFSALDQVQEGPKDRLKEKQEAGLTLPIGPSSR